MAVSQLIYASRPFGFNEWTLNDILFAARRCNKRDGITGALICRNDLYLQLLEGDRALIEATYRRIEADDRHVEITKLWAGDVDKRQFPNWDMRHDPVRSWMWTSEEVENGALTSASPIELQAIFARLAAEPVAAGAFN